MSKVWRIVNDTASVKVGDLLSWTPYPHVQIWEVTAVGRNSVIVARPGEQLECIRRFGGTGFWRLEEEPLPPSITVANSSGGYTVVDQAGDFAKLLLRDSGWLVKTSSEGFFLNITELAWMLDKLKEKQS